MKKAFILIFVLIILAGVAQAASINDVEEAILKDDYALAEKKARGIINTDDSRSGKDRVYYLLALSQLKQGKLEQAAENFEKVVTKYFNSPLKDDAYIGIGDACYEMDNFEKALKNYELAAGNNTADNDTLHLAYINMARTLDKMGRYKEAKYYYGLISEKYPSSFEAVKALEFLKKGGSNFGVQVGAFANKGNALDLQKKLETMGYDAKIHDFNVAGKVFYKVRVGQMLSKSEADMVKGQLKKDGYAGRVVE